MPEFNEFDSEFAAAPVIDTNVATELTGDPNKHETQPEQHEQAPEGAPKWRREIDLGDGSGIQAFEADTAEELVDKFTAAQTHATKKIRQQETQLKELRKTAAREPSRVSADATNAWKPKEYSADEKFQLAEKFKVDPLGAFDEILEARYGVKGDDIVSLKSDRQQRIEAEHVASTDREFLADHKDDFHPSVSNANAIINFLRSENLPYTKANLDYAFLELSDSGLLEAKPDAAAQGESQVKAHTRTKPQSTGIRNTGSTNRREPDNANATAEADVNKILKEPDLEKARAEMLKLMRARSSSSSR